MTTATPTTTEWEQGTGMESEPEPRAGMRLSAAEFMELPDTYDRRRMELDDGVLYIMPRPKLIHQSAWGRVAYHFLNYQDRFEELPIEVYPGIILELWSERPLLLLSPDLVVLRQGGSAVATETRVTGAPDIVVEILSSDRNRDLVRKRRLYAEAGVLEYWIWDLEEGTVTVLELQDDGAYATRAVLSSGDILTTPLLPGLAIPLADIFRHRSRPAPGA